MWQIGAWAEYGWASEAWEEWAAPVVAAVRKGGKGGVGAGWISKPRLGDKKQVDALYVMQIDRNDMELFELIRSLIEQGVLNG